MYPSASAAFTSLYFSAATLTWASVGSPGLAGPGSPVTAVDASRNAAAPNNEFNISSPPFTRANCVARPTSNKPS